jgi:hypothetical protein
MELASNGSDYIPARMIVAQEVEEFSCNRSRPRSDGHLAVETNRFRFC